MNHNQILIVFSSIFQKQKHTLWRGTFYAFCSHPFPFIMLWTRVCDGLHKNINMKLNFLVNYHGWLIRLHFFVIKVHGTSLISNKIKDYKLWGFQWYIICMKKLIFWCTSFKMGSRWLWGLEYLKHSKTKVFVYI